MTRLYHLILIRDDGTKHRLTGYPMSHKECMTMKSKFNPSQQASITVEEVCS